MTYSLPEKYRIKFTGQELDTILRTVRYKLDQSRIANDFKGGALRISSAELMKTLKAGTDSFYDPTQLRELIESIPGINFLTDEMVDKINRMSEKFKGVFRTENERNAAVAFEVDDYTGLELTLILDNGDGFAKWQYYETTGGSPVWTDIDLYTFGFFNSLTLPVTPEGEEPAFHTLASFKAEDFTYIKYLIYMTHGNSIDAVEVGISIDSVNRVSYTVKGHTGVTTTELKAQVVTGDLEDVMLQVKGVDGAVVKSCIVTFIETTEYNTIFHFDGTHIGTVGESVYANIADGGIVGFYGDITWNLDGGDVTLTPPSAYNHIADGGLSWAGSIFFDGGLLGQWPDSYYDHYADGNNPAFEAFRLSGGVTGSTPPSDYNNTYDGGSV